MKLKGWFGVALMPLAVIQVGCGDDSVCSGAIALGIFQKTAGVLKADGSLWTWTQFDRAEFDESTRPRRALANTEATGFANGQLCIRLRNGDVSCPLIPFAESNFPAHSREVAIWIDGTSFVPLFCAVLADGTLNCGPSGTTPAYVPIRGGVRNVSVGSTYYCAITNDGTLACDSFAPDYSSGGGPWAGAGTTLSGIVEVATATGVSGGSVARDAAGDVWGLQELRFDNTITVAVERVLAIDGPVIQVAAGPTVFCALRADGAVFCWRDDNNIISPGGVTDILPQRIKLPRAASAIAIGPGHGAPFACALLDDTTVWCWGAFRDGFSPETGQYVAACG